MTFWSGFAWGFGTAAIIAVVLLVWLVIWSNQFDDEDYYP